MERSLRPIITPRALIASIVGLFLVFAPAWKVGVATDMFAPVFLLVYSRFVHLQDLAELPTRSTLLQLIQAAPGIDIRLVPGRIGVSRGTVLYHVQMLERGALIRVIRDGRKQFLYSAREAPQRDAQNLALLRHPVAVELLRCLSSSEAGKAKRKDLHKAIAHIPKRTRNLTIARLLASEVIAADGKGSNATLQLRRPCLG